MDDNSTGFGLVQIKQEGCAVPFDKDSQTDGNTIPSEWMELRIVSTMSEEDIIERVRRWIKEERRFG